MADGSKIDWTDASWNFARGCTRVSPGCEHCYAEAMAHRFPWGKGLTVLRQARPGWSGEVQLVPHKLTEPLRWRKPRRIFPCSGSDLFHPKIPFEYIAAAYAVMVTARQHTYQVLTKRPERMLEFYQWVDAQATQHGDHLDTLEDARYAFLRSCFVEKSDPEVELRTHEPPSWDHIWAGTSAEDQKRLDERMVFLRQIPAKVRWLSVEPMLGPVDLTEYIHPSHMTRCLVHHNRTEHPCGSGPDPLSADCDVCGIEWHDDRPDVQWIVVGGESGRGARPCAYEWIERVAQQCCEAKVPVFVKQLGALIVSEHRAAETVEEANACRKAAGHSLRDDRWLWFAGLRDAKGSDPSEWPDDRLKIRLYPGDRVPPWPRSSPAEDGIPF